MKKISMLRSIVVVMLMMFARTATAHAQGAMMFAGTSTVQADGAGGDDDYDGGTCPLKGCDMDEDPQSNVRHWFAFGIPHAEHCHGIPLGHGYCHDTHELGQCSTHPSCLTGFVAMDKAVRTGDINEITAVALAYPNVLLTAKGVIVRSQCDPTVIAAFRLRKGDVTALRIALEGGSTARSLGARIAAFAGFASRMFTRTAMIITTGVASA